MVNVIEVELKMPIEAHGEEITTLKLRRPNFGDMMQMDNAKGEMAKFAKLIEVCGNIPPSSVKKIDVEDVNRIAEAIGPFFSAFPQTGSSAE
jgi:hypothetical protein